MGIAEVAEPRLGNLRCVSNFLRRPQIAVAQECLQNQFGMQSLATFGMSQRCFGHFAGVRHLSCARLPWAGAARPINALRRSPKLSRTHFHCQVTRSAATLERSDMQQEEDCDRCEVVMAA